MTQHIRKILLFTTLIACLQAGAIGRDGLGAKLTQYAGFNTHIVPRVRVERLNVNGQRVDVHTNQVLAGLSLTQDELQQLRDSVGAWVLGDSVKATVRIYSDGHELSELLTDRVKRQPYHYPVGSWHWQTDSAGQRHIGQVLLTGDTLQAKHGLNGKYIALWPSHGLFYKQQTDTWIWQRATMWTTVEDLYSVEYTRLVRRMLENAGAVVFQPRASIEGNDLWQDADGQWLWAPSEASHAPGPSDFPRWMEGARYWLEYAGFPDSIWSCNNGKNDYRDDLQCRGNWINYLSGGSTRNPKQSGLGVPLDLSLAIHTDGYDAPNDSDVVGTLAIYSTVDRDKGTRLSNGQSRDISRQMADYVQTQVVEDIREKYNPQWKRRQLLNSGYCEAKYPVIPSMILEILSHKSMTDMHYGLQPAFRWDVARAIYKGLLRYLHAADQSTFIVQPLPVVDCQLAYREDSILLHWRAQDDPLEPTATPDYYVVYQRIDDGEWQPAYRTSDTQVCIMQQPGKRYDYYVVAGNEGGVSFPSQQLSAYLSATRSHDKMVLIIDGFASTYGPRWFADSLNAGLSPDSYAVEEGMYPSYIGQQNNWDRKAKWVNDNNCGWGMCYRDHEDIFTRGNTHDYAVQHGCELQQMDISYLSQSLSSLSDIDSCVYVVDLVLGKQQAEGNQPILNAEQRTILSLHLARGGSMLVSGSYLCSGLNDEASRQWAKNELHYQLVAPKANHGGTIRIDNPIYSHKHVHLQTTPSDQLLHCEAAEGIQPVGKNTIRVAHHRDTHLDACVGYSGQKTRTLVWSCPLESLWEFEDIYTESIEWLYRP